MKNDVVPRSQVCRKIGVTHLGKYYPPHPGGMETYLQQVCEATMEEVNLRVLVSNDRAVTKREVVQGVPVERLARYAVVASTPMVPSFFGEIKRDLPDIYHLHHPNPVPTMAALLNVDFTRSKLVISYQADITNQRILKKFFEPFLHMLCERASAIITNNPSMVEHSKFLQQHRDKCCMIPLPFSAADWDRNTCLESAAALRAQTTRPVVLSVGRLVPYKGFEYLIAAMSRVDADLWIIGDGPLRSKLIECVRNAGVQDKVKLLGKVDRLQDYYAAADLFTLASINEAEAYGIVQMEAMASRLPVVNTDLPSGVPFVSRANETGLTVPPKDVEALAVAINNLLKNETMRRDFGHAARKRVESEFDTDVIKAKTLEVYRRVTGTNFESVVTMESPAMAL